MINIYIGKNGIGKTEELKRLYDENSTGYKFFIESTKNSSPETLEKDGANGFWNELEKYLNENMIKDYTIEYKKDFKDKIF